MNVSKQITNVKNEILKKIMLLEVDSRFSDLVSLLKQKEIEIDKKFENNQDKTLVSWQKYYAELQLFLEQDIYLVVKMYYRHKNDDLSIYDDSSKEINEELLLKEQEIKKCIEETDSSYHDEIITNYIKTKYELIMTKYQTDLYDVLRRNEISLKNNLTDNYQEVIPLTTYNNCTLIKERCLSELIYVLDDFISYIKSLMENKELISNQEKLIDEIIMKINDNNLRQEFIMIKNNYYQSVTHINSIDTRIGGLQKNYFHELEKFYDKVKECEKIFDEKIKVQSYVDYLKETPLYVINFTVLLEINKYLQNHDHLELQRLFNNTCYQIIKLEVRYNDGKSYLYRKLGNHVDSELERLFLIDLKLYQGLLMSNNCFEEFLTSNFSLTLLKKFADLTMLENLEELINEDELTKMKYSLVNSLPGEISKSQELIYFISDSREKFDDNGEALISANGTYYVVNRNGNVKKVVLHQPNNDKHYEHNYLTYHDGVLMYKCEPSFANNRKDTYYIIADTKEDIGDHVCAILNDEFYDDELRISDFKAYSEGLIQVKDERYDTYYFIDKTGRIKLLINNNSCASMFRSGYVLVENRFTSYIDYAFKNKKGKICKRYYYFDKRKKFLQPCSFTNGVMIGPDDNFSKLCLFDTNFKPIYEDYEPMSVRVSGRVSTIYIKNLKSKTDGQTYIIEKDGLIPMSIEQMENYYLISKYTLIEMETGELKFVLKEDYHINSFIDTIDQHIKKQKVRSR